MESVVKSHYPIKVRDLDSFTGEIYHNFNKEVTEKLFKPLLNIAERGFAEKMRMLTKISWVLP